MTRQAPNADHVNHHARKITTARKLSNWGKYPETFAAVLNAVPRELIGALTGKQIALLIDTMREQHLRGQAQGYKEAQ